MGANLGGPVFTATATGAGGRHQLYGTDHTFSVSGETSSGAGAVTVKVQVSNEVDPDHDAISGDDLADWMDAGTITLTLGTTMTSDGFGMARAYRWARYWVTAISGTDAAVTCFYGRAR